MTFVIIPYNVTNIGNYAFSACGLNYISIQRGVISIGEGAFYACDYLSSVLISSNVTSIGDNAFGYCNTLTTITVDPANPAFTSLAGVLFSKSQAKLIQFPGGNAGSYTIPATVISIGDYSFYGCDSLTNVIVLNNVTNIGNYAFKNSGLISVTIGSNVTSIGDMAFNFCSHLTAITVDAANPAYSSVAGVLLNKSQTTLIQFPGGKSGSYTIPSNVTSIGDFSFSSCYSLTSVSIGNNVTNIGNEAFKYSGLTSVTIGNNIASIGSNMFYASRAPAALSLIHI